MKKITLPEKISKFFEKHYLIIVGGILLIKTFIDNPLFSGLIQESKRAKSIFRTQSWEEVVLSTIIITILSGIYFNGKKIQQLEEGFTSEFKNYGAYQLGINMYAQQNENFSSIVQRVQEEQKILLSKLADGILSVQLELMEKAQTVLMRLFYTRMDAVSYDDLFLWTSVPQKSLGENTSKDKIFDSDVGHKYYHKILDIREINRTVLTRIFLLDRSQVEENIDEVSSFIKQHMDDRIGVALAFTDDLDRSDSTVKSWFEFRELGPRQPRIDFALFDKEMAVSFFRKHSPQRFEAVLNVDNWAELLRRQREIHKTLVVTSLFGTQLFYDLIFKNTPDGPGKTIKQFYNASEKREIKHVISRVRAEFLSGRKESNPGEFEQMFSVTLSNEEYKTNEKLDLVKKKIQESIGISKKHRLKILNFTKILDIVNRH